MIFDLHYNYKTLIVLTNININQWKYFLHSLQPREGSKGFLSSIAERNHYLLSIMPLDHRTTDNFALFIWFHFHSI